MTPVNISMKNKVFREGVLVLALVLMVGLSITISGCKNGQPQTAEQHLELAQAYLKEGKFDQAYVHLSKALELNPQDPDIHENLSWLYLYTDKLPQAESEFETLKTLRPEGASTEYLNGAILAKLEKHRNALQHYQKARQSGYEEPGIFYDMGQSLMAVKEDAQALLVFNQGLSRLPEADTNRQVNFLFSICLANYHLEQFNEAKNFCQWAFDITPDEDEKQNINHILHNIQLLQVMETEPESDIDISEYIKEGHDPNSDTAIEGGVPADAVN